ncbi:MAG: hypothetical protein CMJ94_01700 [Planctomycetes bacterium]|nr:hypothetical protein [Planctomycetota bacterium]
MLRFCLTRSAALACLVAAAGACQQPSKASSGPEIARTVYLMGTEARLFVEADQRAQALHASEAALRSLERAELRLSTWRPEAELFQVNAGAQPSPRLAAELAEAAAWTARTDGAFEPRCAALVAAWGLRSEARIPSPAELAVAVEARTQWEEGGFGKGAALRDAAQALAAAPGVRRARIDLGGQWLLHGEGLFTLEVADPDHRDRSIGSLRLPAGSVATSGNSERGIEVEGRRIGHILDPRTGQPAPDFGSVTVVHPDPFTADCLATAFLVLGPERALAWAEAEPELGVLVIERGPTGPRVRVSTELRPHFHPLP